MKYANCKFIKVLLKLNNDLYKLYYIHFAKFAIMAVFRRYTKEFNETLDRTIWYMPQTEIKYIKGSAETKDKLCQIYKLKNSKFDTYYQRLLAIFQLHFLKDADINNKFATYFHEVMSVKNTDKNIYEKLREFYISLNYTYDEPDCGQNITRGIFDKIILDKTPTNYLNYGCLDDVTTNAIGKYFDLSEEYIKSVNIIDYNTDALPYDVGSFDLITCLMALHHIHPKKLDSILNELYRIMADDGILIIKEYDVNPKDKYMRYILDIKYDVLKESPCKTKKNHFLSEAEFDKKLKKIGFKINQAPEYDRNAQFNPFNTYIKAYSKISLDDMYKCIGGRPAMKKFFRILDNNISRKKYHRRATEKKNVLHWGQRKLLLTEIEFLTIYYTKLRTTSNKKEPYMIYAGAAPGTHLMILSEMFPDVHFILYDPRDFDPDLGSYPMIEINQQLFLDVDAKKWISDDHPDKDILLVSDIRTGEPFKMTDEQVEKQVRFDHKLQYDWYKIMKPVLSMFKFRLPWIDGQTPYLDGEIYIQPYPPQTSTETRLIVYGADAADILYDNKKYEEQLFYFNTELREAEYKNILEKIDTHDKCGLNNKYDCVAEINILSNYLKFIKNPANL